MTVSSRDESPSPSITEEARQWTFQISLNLQGGEGFAEAKGGTHHQASTKNVSVPSDLCRSFREDGFVVFPEPVVSKAACDALNQNLEEILRGRAFTRGVPPDKAPRYFKNEYEGSAHIAPKVDLSSLSIAERQQIKKKPPQAVVGPIGFSGNHDNVRVIQVVNVHKSNHLYRQLACSPTLGRVVATLAGWKCGARLASDQIWAKPPGAAPLTFHRDSPYFNFVPDAVVTVWLALDDMHPDIGPLQYVKGSHLWGEGRVGSASQFFQSNGGIALLKSAAEREGVVSSSCSSSEFDGLEIVSMAGLKTGAMSIHNGRTWHGSGKNCSRTLPRRGLGLHFVPANVRFTADALMSRLWRPYVQDVLATNGDVGSIELPVEDFPITWQPSDDDNAEEKKEQGV